MLSNVEIVERLQDIGHYKDSPEAEADYARLMSSDLVIIEPACIPYGGRFQGAQEIARFDEIYHSCWTHTEHRVLRYISEGEYVACYVELDATSRKTGRTVHTRVSEWWRVVDGKVVEIEIFYYDPVAVLDVLEAEPRRESSSPSLELEK